MSDFGEIYFKNHKTFFLYSLFRFRPMSYFFNWLSCEILQFWFYWSMQFVFLFTLEDSYFGRCFENQYNFLLTIYLISGQCLVFFNWLSCEVLKFCFYWKHSNLLLFTLADNWFDIILFTLFYIWANVIFLDWLFCEDLIFSFYWNIAICFGSLYKIYNMK